VAWNGGQGGAKFEKFDQVCVRLLLSVFVTTLGQIKEFAAAVDALQV
jgi:hypothetical protein